MKPSTELFSLIKSLSKSEKRFFKLTSNLQSGEKNYVRIFDFIDAQKEYDEEALKDEFKNEKFIKHLSSEKTYLYKLILKSLRSFYSEDSLKSILFVELKNIEILFNKALYKECKKNIVRAKKLAQETESFYFWIDIIYWEKKLIEEGYQLGVHDEALKQLVEEEEDVLNKLRNLAEYQIIYSKINTLYRTGGFSRSPEEEAEVEKIENYHLIIGQNTAISIRAASICYYIKGLCAATNRNYEDSYTYFNRTCFILNNNPVIKYDLSVRYIQTLFYLIRCCIDSRNFEKASKLISDLKALASSKEFNTINLEIRILSSAYTNELIMLQRQGLFEQSVELIQEIDAFIEKFNSRLSKEQLLNFNFYKSISYFGTKDLKKSLYYINEILNDNEQNIRQDIYSFSRIFNLVIHFELGNYDFAEYAVKSANRYLAKRNRDYEIETVLIKNIELLAKSKDDQNEMFKSLQTELESLLKNKHDKAILEYFNISAWVESKINMTSFKETVLNSQM